MVVARSRSWARLCNRIHRPGSACLVAGCRAAQRRAGPRCTTDELPIIKSTTHMRVCMNVAGMCNLLKFFFAVTAHIVRDRETQTEREAGVCSNEEGINSSYILHTNHVLSCICMKTRRPEKLQCRSAVLTGPAILHLAFLRGPTPPNKKPACLRRAGRCPGYCLRLASFSCLLPGFLIIRPLG